jgi:hypothetical protein
MLTGGARTRAYRTAKGYKRRTCRGCASRQLELKCFREDRSKLAMPLR